MQACINSEALVIYYSAAAAAAAAAAAISDNISCANQSQVFAREAEREKEKRSTSLHYSCCNSNWPRPLVSFLTPSSSLHKPGCREGNNYHYKIY